MAEVALQHAEVAEEIVDGIGHRRSIREHGVLPGMSDPAGEVEPHLPGCRCENTGEQIEQRRLPGAVVADDGEAVGGSDGEIDAVQHETVGEPDGGGLQRALAMNAGRSVGRGRGYREHEGSSPAAHAHRRDLRR